MKLFMLAACAFATACGGDAGTTTPTPTSMVGTWNVSAVNGSPLPYIVRQDDTGKITMVSGAAVFTSDGKFTMTENYLIQVTGQAPATQSPTLNGTYSVSSNALLLYDPSTGTSNAAALVGNKFTFTARNDLATLSTEFTKQ